MPPEAIHLPPPNPHIVAMPIPVDTSFPLVFPASPEVEIKPIDYPYNWVTEFTLTFYSKELLKEDIAFLYDSKGKIAEGQVKTGKTLTFGGNTYSSFNVLFSVGGGLLSQEIRAIVPNELFGSPGGHELKFMFGDKVVPLV